MFLVLLVLCTFGNKVYTDDVPDSDDEGKFIDLLPQEEKDAFIESVARRLITGVKTKDSRYRSNEEISEEELSQQNEYVRKVLQEENSNLRREGKIKESEEKVKVQGLAKNNKESKIDDEDDREHVDLTLRQGNRRKRNERELNLDVENEEFIPVKTVYDDENQGSATELNTKSTDDGIEDVNISKERIEEISTAEDIQVRGHRSLSRGSRQINTDPPILQESPNDATEIVDFDPEESFEHNATHEENRNNTNNNTEDNTQTLSTIEEVEVTTKSTEDLESSHNTFTKPIYEPQESGNESDRFSNESADSTTNTSEATATTVQVTEETTTENLTTVTQDIKESTTVENVLSTTEHALSTNGKKYLRDDHENNDQEETLKTLDETTIKVEVVLDNKKDDKSEDTIKSTKNTSEERDQLKIIPRDMEVSSNINKTDESSINDVDLYDSTTINALPSRVKLAIQSSIETDRRDIDSNIHNSEEKANITIQMYKGSKEIAENDSNNININDTKINATDIEKNGEFNTEAAETNIVTNISDINHMKHSVKDMISTEKVNEKFVTENYEALTVNEIVTKEDNSSYISTKGDLRSYVENTSSENNLNDKTSVETDKDDILNTSKSIDFDTNDHFKYIKFKKIPENGENVLTTTEKNNEISNNNDTPKYSIYYSYYVPNPSNNESNIENDKNESSKESNELQLESESANLEKIAIALRKGISEEYEQTHIEQQSEEIEPKILQSSGKIKEYLVYEIPPGKSPFVEARPESVSQNSPEIKEQPYYVPVYNYDPSNVYYNAYNRLGPNEEDNDEELTNVNERHENSFETVKSNSRASFDSQELDGHRKFKFTGKKNSAKIKIVPKFNNFGLPIVIKRPKVAEIYFNPDDYMDMDYYFERSDRPIYRTRKEPKVMAVPGIFPNSDDEAHPINNMGRGAKSHLEAVRQMMYDQNIFGFLPDETTDKSTTVDGSHEDHDHKHDHHHHHGDHDKVLRKFRTENKTDYIIFVQNGKLRKENPHRQDISVDYYFGIYNTEIPKSSIFKEFLRERKSAQSDLKGKDIKGNKTALSNLIGEIKRRGLKVLRGRKRDPHLEDSKKHWKENAGSIKDIIGLGDLIDVFPNLEKLKKMNLTLVRRRHSDEEIKVYLNVLRDMVETGNKALDVYDWLGSTVDILAALKKLRYLTSLKQNHDKIHPADLELLNYVQYLYKVSRSSLNSEEEATLRHPKKEHKNALPKNRHRKKQYLTKGLMNRVWLYKREDTVANSDSSYSDESDIDEEFLTFLDSLQNCLYDLHNALKHISMVTQYKRQHWFRNLKTLYLKSAEKKAFLEILLHIFTTRLLEAIEESSVSELEDGFLTYVQQNEKEVERTKNDFVVVFKLMTELKNVNK